MTKNTLLDLFILIIACAGFFIFGNIVGFQSGRDQGVNYGMYLFCLTAPLDDDNFVYEVPECSDIVARMREANLQLTPVSYFESR